MNAKDHSEDEDRDNRLDRGERSAGMMVAERLQDEVRSAVQSIRSARWVPSPGRED